MTDNTIGATISADIAGVKAFIQREETIIQQDVLDAYNWLKKELELLAPEILADLKTAISVALAEVIAGDSEGVIVANTLTILARDGVELLAQVKTSVVEALVGLTAQSTAAP